MSGTTTPAGDDLSTGTAQELRALRNLREHHESKIKDDTERIAEFASNMLGRLAKGHASSVSLYAADIATAAQRIASNVAALETLDAVQRAGITAAGETS